MPAETPTPTTPDITISKVPQFSSRAYLNRSRSSSSERSPSRDPLADDNFQVPLFRDRSYLNRRVTNVRERERIPSSEEDNNFEVPIFQDRSYLRIIRRPSSLGEIASGEAFRVPRPSHNYISEEGRRPEEGRMPTPEGAPSGVLSPTNAEQFLRVRARSLGLTVDEDVIAAQTDKLVHLHRALGTEKFKKLIQSDYLSQTEEYDTLDKMLAIDSDRIRLAMEVSDKVDSLREKNGYKKEFVPALKVASYVVLEGIQDRGWGAKTAGEIQELIEGEIKAQARGDKKTKWGESAVLRHARIYLSKINPSLSGSALEQALVQQVSHNLHRKLGLWSRESEWLGQSQGIEIEVLKYKQREGAARNRGVSEKQWYPRALTITEHARQDWNLLPFLGVDEDLGERRHQEYEMATNPSEAAANQAMMTFLFMAGKWVTEGKLSDDSIPNERKGKEAYSLHISTAFPRAILNRGSLAQYTEMARALAGAYATDQRISIGGFMSGGTEISDKSPSGNLRRPGDRPGESEDSGKALVEIRTLDLTHKDHYGAIMNKEVMDFAFRCAWEKIANPKMTQTAVEAFAARSWKNFQGELNTIYRSYGIDAKAMQKKYGAFWRERAWKDMAATRVANPELKQQLEELFDRHAKEIRKFRRENGEGVGLIEESSVDAEIESPIVKGQEPRRLRAETERGVDDRFYMSYEDRLKYGIKPGQEIFVRVGRASRKVQVEFARSGQPSGWMFSENVYKDLGMDVIDRVTRDEEGNGGVRVRFDKDTGEFQLGPSVALLQGVTGRRGNLRIRGGSEFYRVAAEQAKKKGVFVCVIDVNQQDPELYKKGLAKAVVFGRNGKLEEVTIPIPDVSYDKDVTPRDQIKDRQPFMNKFEHHVVSLKQQEITGDKLKFAEVFENSELSGYLPDTDQLTPQRLPDFFNKHDSVFFKRRRGQKGLGLFSVDKAGDGGYSIRYTVGEDDSRRVVEKYAAEPLDILRVMEKKMGNLHYVMQQKIKFREFPVNTEGKGRLMYNPQFRVVIQRGEGGEPKVSGVVARLMERDHQEELIWGGRYAMKRAFPELGGDPAEVRKKMKELEILSLKGLKVMEKAVGQFVGEVTFDIGIKEDGQFVFIEANSKAETRNMFEDIEDTHAAELSTGSASTYALSLTDM